ncbi:MAG: cation diffusion facilitator family transporter [Rhodocyclaceae bacterium]|jgi:cation diffusion facilitator family transporter|nr:cation diffusion facilitator family transporter [Rhodocyclaceae bacterium]MCC6878393.1 cation transporter [Rhodocyclaceae bacterium]MCL4680637.1 cation diffusion facilitator family transporter [Rhodocyclaceae bacterium]
MRAGPVDPQRYRAASRATWISAALNLALTAAQLVVGWLAHSQSLIAHGLHSFSDLLSDFLVLYANRQGSHPADREHPYGHARVETAATLILGASLAVIGFGILWEATLRLQHVADLPPVELLALWVAIITAVAKEILFRYLIRVAGRLRSPMLAANAWHTRADAASALVVVVGIAGALLGWTFLDLLAAAIMGFMILRMGLKLGWESLQELIDTGLEKDKVEAIRRTLLETPGVLGLHELRTRRMAHQALVDAHVLVDPRISVSEGHRLGERARRRVLDAHGEVADVLVHIDAEEDQALMSSSAALPDRDALMAHLKGLLGEEAAGIEKTVLHYLGSRVEAEVFLPFEVCRDMARLGRLEERIALRLKDDPIFRAISLNCRIAPK